MRAGTENVASIVGMATALKKNVAFMKDTATHLTALENRLLAGLSAANIRFSRNGSNAHIPGNLSLSFPGYSGEALLHRLDLMGICISTGSACDSGYTKFSHVIKAINVDESYAKGTIRIALGKNNTLSEIETIIYSLRKILSD